MGPTLTAADCTIAPPAWQPGAGAGYRLLGKKAGGKTGQVQSLNTTDRTESARVRPSIPAADHSSFSPGHRGVAGVIGVSGTVGSAAPTCLFCSRCAAEDRQRAGAAGGLPASAVSGIAHKIALAASCQCHPPVQRTAARNLCRNEGRLERGEVAQVRVAVIALQISLLEIRRIAAGRRSRHARPAHAALKE